MRYGATVAWRARESYGRWDIAKAIGHADITVYAQ